jgi:hypothetical protein
VTSSVGIVVPAFRPNVERLQAYVRAIHEEIGPDVVRIELDDPEPGVREALADLEATVNAVDRRRGKGAAITAGFEALETDVLGFADADGATPASSLATVVDWVRDGDADLAVGSRRHPDATVRSHQTVARRHLGNTFAWMARRLLDAQLYDYQCGAKALTAETWESVNEHLTAPGFAWDIELIALVAAQGGRIAEVPVIWEDQPGSTVSTGRTSLALARGLIRARIRAKATAQHPLYELVSGDQVPLLDRSDVVESAEPGPRSQRSGGTER